MRGIGGRLMQIAAAIAVASLGGSGFAFTTVNPEMSMQQMSETSDEIIVGSVVGQNTRIVGSTFESDYQIQVSENLKTKGELPAGKNFTLTLPGGSIEEPPLGQYVMGTPYMFKGEEVVLFLKKGSGKEAKLPREAVAAGQVTKLSDSYKVVGYNQGRFDVVTNPETGKRMVTRVNLENYGLMADSPAVRQAIQAIANKRVQLVEKQLVRQKDAASEARDKDPLEFTGSDGKQIKVEQSLQKAEGMKNRRQRALTVQDFEEFKAQIKASVNSY